MAATYSEIPNLLIAAIKANSTCFAKLGSRIHYQTIPESSDYPHVFIARKSRTNEMMLGGEDEPTEDNFAIEVASRTFDDELLQALNDCLNAIEGFDSNGTWIYFTIVNDADDEYVFQSADGDGIFLHAFDVLVVHS